jgi:hypothetical protein
MSSKPTRRAFTVRFEPDIAQRIERVRDLGRIDGARLAEQPLVVSLIRRGLDSLELELGITNEEPRKAA